MSREAGGTVVAAFQTDAEAERALERLTSSGIQAGDISVVMRDSVPHSRVGVDTGSNLVAAGGIGALFGALLGGALAWFLALETMALPGTGPYSGIGSIASSVTGGLLGAIIGGLGGALVGLRIPVSPEAEGAAGARIMVTVRTPAESDPGQVEEVLAANGGREVRAVPASRVQTAAASEATAGTGAEPLAPANAPVALDDFS
ncbi:MAG TPA: general stress protein [Chloroflexia bacterium]|nr:general stress protein [Chloroflexia bacterium]